MKREEIINIIQKQVNRGIKINSNIIPCSDQAFFEINKLVIYGVYKIEVTETHLKLYSPEPRELSVLLSRVDNFEIDNPDYAGINLVCRKDGHNVFSMSRIDDEVDSASMKKTYDLFKEYGFKLLRVEGEYHPQYYLESLNDYDSGFDELNCLVVALLRTLLKLDQMQY